MKTCEHCEEEFVPSRPGFVICAECLRKAMENNGIPGESK